MVRAGKRCLALLAAAVLSAAGVQPLAAADQPPRAFMAVGFELPEGGAYAQEMVVLRVRSFFKARATLERLEQPALGDLGWVQLGRDTWAPTKVDNETFFGFERRIALFAPEDGSYVIPPFTHHVTLIDADDRRWLLDVRSQPTTLDIKPWTEGSGGPEDEDTWWLPAQSVVVTDEWAADPAGLAAGQIVRRIVEVAATGVSGEQLPPAIETISPGVIVFPGPVERRTEIVDGVPVGHARYSYDVRPHTGSAAILRETLVPWFDTEARRMRQAIVPGASVGRGMVIPGVPLADEAADTGSFPLALAVGALAFLAGLALLLAPGAQDREAVPARIARRLANFRKTWPLRLAALRGRRGDVRTALYRLARGDGDAGYRWLADPRVRAALGALDLELFGSKPDRSQGRTGLRRLCQAVLSARRRVLSRRPMAATADRLAPH